MLSASILALFVGLLPAPAHAVDCNRVTLTFDVLPKTVNVGEESQFKTSFAWQGGTPEECFDTPVTFVWNDNFQAQNYEIRRRERATREPIRLDFNQRWITTPGYHRFSVKVLVNDSQVSESALVQVTAAGEGVSTQAEASYAEGPPSSGPVPLEVRIGNLTEAANLAEYIAAVFRYALSIGGILATVMVVYGGAKWLLAAGDSGKISEAKSTITNAVLGLILLLGSYTILVTVNPEITRLRALKLPKVERAILASNWCEDQDLNTVKVTPVSGQCGRKGTIEPREGAGPVTSDMCTFQTCPQEQVCSGFGGTFECRSCGDIDDNRLEAWRLTEDDAGCAPFAPRAAGGRFQYCFFSEDNRLDPNVDVCAYADVRCSQIDSCRDYDDIFLVHQGRPIEIDSETKDAYGGYNPDHLRQICQSNPCNVAGGCVLRESSSLSQFLTDVGSLKGPPSGDLYDCESP